MLPDFEIVTKSVQCARSGKKTESIGNVGGPVIFDRDYDSSLLNLSKTKATCPNSAIFEHFQKWPKNQGDVLAPGAAFQSYPPKDTL